MIDQNAEYFEIELPGIKLYEGLERLQIKKITPFIHKKLLSLYTSEANISSLMTFINNLILNFDLNELYLDDLSYMLYQIRLTCYKMIPLEVEIVCPDCEQKTKVLLDTASLEIKECTELPKVKLDNFGDVTIRYRKVGDDAKIDKLLVSKQLDKEDLFYRTLAVDALVLDQWKPVEEVWDMMETGEITTEDTLRIEDTLINKGYGVKQRTTYECKNCGKEVTQDFEMNLSDYFPATINK